MKTKHVWFLLTLLCAVGLASQASGAGLGGSYLAIKGGVYSPSASFNLENVDLATTFDGDTETGFSGEIAFGHYFLPTVALELGLGYFKGKGSLTPPGGGALRDASFDVIPLIASAKVLVPIGPVYPYGEAGLGAYFTTFEVTDNANSFSGTTTLGMHAGAGMNVTLSPRMFLGLEGRYVWANPSFGGETIRLNDTEYALNGFKLNGFTTMLGVGFNF